MFNSEKVIDRILGKEKKKLKQTIIFPEAINNWRKISLSELIKILGHEVRYEQDFLCLYIKDMKLITLSRSSEKGISYTDFDDLETGEINIDRNSRQSKSHDKIMNKALEIMNKY